MKNTKFMIFFRKRNIHLNLNVTINNVIIERKTEARFLGVIVDKKSKWTKL